jgi:hypothetical protein
MPPGKNRQLTGQPEALLGRCAHDPETKAAHLLRSFCQAEPKQHLAGSWRRALQLMRVPWSKR